MMDTFHVLICTLNKTIQIYVHCYVTLFPRSYAHNQGIYHVVRRAFLLSVDRNTCLVLPAIVKHLFPPRDFI